MKIHLFQMKLFQFQEVNNFRMEEIGKIQQKALIKSKLYLNKFGNTKYDKKKNNIF